MAEKKHSQVISPLFDFHRCSFFLLLYPSHVRWCLQSPSSPRLASPSPDLCLAIIWSGREGGKVQSILPLYTMNISRTKTRTSSMVVRVEEHATCLRKSHSMLRGIRELLGNARCFDSHAKKMLLVLLPMWRHNRWQMELVLHEVL